MPRLSTRSKNPQNQQEHNCCFKIPKDAYTKIRVLAAQRTCTMKELYRQAVVRFADQETEQQTASGSGQ